MQTNIYSAPRTDVFVRYKFGQDSIDDKEPTAADEMKSLTTLSICYRFSITKYRDIVPFVSYAFSDKFDNALLFFQTENSLNFYYNDKKESSTVEVDDTLDAWHHHCFIFNEHSLWLYVDGEEVLQRTLEGSPAEIPLNGTLYLGQEQDSLDGGLDKFQSLSGYITQVNFWNYQLDDTDIQSIAACSSNKRGNIFSTDTTEVETSYVAIETVAITKFCDQRKKFIIIPEKFYPSEASEFCTLADSTLYISEDAEANAHLFNVSRQFVEVCDGKSYRLMFLGATDDKEEGKWTRVADGESLSYTAWGAGEPNGGSKRNCLVLRRHDDRWGDVDCNDRLCFPCGRTNQDYLQLRGLCQDQEHRTRFLLDGYINGKPFFRGYYELLIFYSGENEWTLYDTTINDTLAILYFLRSSDYPVGRHIWNVHVSFCDNIEGSSVVLGLSICTTQEFMCSDGSCVPRSLRCNLRDDCIDGSDEENCTTLLFSDKYHNHRPPPGITFNSPLQITPTVDLIRFSKIDDINLAFHMEIEIELSWIDRNLNFKNIKMQEGKNQLSAEEVTKIWSPETEFLNVNDGQLKRLKSGVYVRLIGDPDPPIFTDVKMDTIYQPSSGELVQKRQYYASFNCKFRLFNYPFDTQTCTILIKLASADTSVLELKNASVVYSGSLQLPKYEVQNVDIVLKTRSDYAVMEVVFLLERRWSLLVLTIFVPTFLLLGIGYGTLYIKLPAFQARAVMTLTTLLVLYTLFNQVSSALPDTAYIKMVDLWFFFCIFLIFSVILIHICVEHLESGEDTVHKWTIKVSPIEPREASSQNILTNFIFSMTAVKLMTISRRIIYPAIVGIFSLVFWILILCL